MKKAYSSRIYCTISYLLYSIYRFDTQVTLTFRGALTTYDNQLDDYITTRAPNDSP